MIWRLVIFHLLRSLTWFHRTNQICAINGLCAWCVRVCALKWWWNCAVKSTKKVTAPANTAATALVCVILGVLMQFHKLLLDSDLNSSLKWCRNDFASRLQCFFRTPTDRASESESATVSASGKENEGKVFSFASVKHPASNGALYWANSNHLRIDVYLYRLYVWHVTMSKNRNIL